MATEHELCIPHDAKRSLRLVLGRALTDKQLLILTRIDGRERSFTSFLTEISDSEDIPLSTVKLSAKILRDLELIAVISDPETGSSAVALTAAGALALTIMLDDDYDKSE
jgi:hypothetical protein